MLVCRRRWKEDKNKLLPTVSTPHSQGCTLIGSYSHFARSFSCHNAMPTKIQGSPIFFLMVKLFLLILIHNLHLDPAGYYWPGRCISHFNAVPLTRQLCDCALYYIICMGLYHDSLHQCFTFIFWKNISPVLPVLTTTVHIFQ